MPSNKQKLRAKKRSPAKPKRRAGGRPSIYKPGFVSQAAKLCQLGARDVDLADFFGVAINTISVWKTRYPEFLGALKAGKEEVDDRVERSLLQRALGYTFDSEKIFLPKDSRTPVRVKTREHCPPDVVAAIFWLKNRRRDEWRDRQEHAHSGPDGKPIETRDVTEMTPNERARRVAFALIAGALAPETREAADGKLDRRSDQASGT
jgi:hypothetical protein